MGTRPRSAGAWPLRTSPAVPLPAGGPPSLSWVQPPLSSRPAPAPRLRVPATAGRTSSCVLVTPRRTHRPPVPGATVAQCAPPPALMPAPSRGRVLRPRAPGSGRGASPRSPESHGGARAGRAGPCPQRADPDPPTQRSPPGGRAPSRPNPFNLLSPRAFRELILETGFPESRWPPGAHSWETMRYPGWIWARVTPAVSRKFWGLPPCGQAAWM